MRTLDVLDLGHEALAFLALLAPVVLVQVTSLLPDFATLLGAGTRHDPHVLPALFVALAVLLDALLYLSLFESRRASAVITRALVGFHDRSRDRGRALSTLLVGGWVIASDRGRQANLGMRGITFLETFLQLGQGLVEKEALAIEVLKDLSSTQSVIR